MDLQRQKHFTLFLILIVGKFFFRCGSGVSEIYPVPPPFPYKGIEVTKLAENRKESLKNLKIKGEVTGVYRIKYKNCNTRLVILTNDWATVHIDFFWNHKIDFIKNLEGKRVVVNLLNSELNDFIFVKDLKTNQPLFLYYHQYLKKKILKRVKIEIENLSLTLYRAHGVNIIETTSGEDNCLAIKIYYDLIFKGKKVKYGKHFTFKLKNHDYVLFNEGFVWFKRNTCLDKSISGELTIFVIKKSIVIEENKEIEKKQVNN